MLQDREAPTRLQLAEAPSLAMWSLSHQQEVYSLAGSEAIWNETRGTPRDKRTKAIIMLSRRANSLRESQIKEKENDIRSMEALMRSPDV